MADTLAPLVVMHTAHGRAEGHRCGECLYFAEGWRRLVPNRPNPVTLHVCRQYPERLVARRRPPFAKSWDACGAFISS